ncbi:GNAT family N-acetyltransferase [Ideonella sp. 4Y16]|uniref:GNAT family N-acetyltransferase n=1 Tax=Ideonella alba TaxID=2824118 RepID=UPI001B37D920|nr:GNAT family N-acyltransferase [Ideonella alba]MBQ0946445.1 GNAT family N-acetyltransferase [Ideonella alba]
MKELPSPTQPLMQLLESPLRRRPPVAPAQPRRALEEPVLEVVWARHQDEVRAAQRLRWRVFVDEMGASLPPTPHLGADHDIDRFDEHCEHLLVRLPGTEGRPAEVIGTYRVLTPAAALRAGGLYSDSEFDLAPLQAWRPRLVELGRSCVHPEHRSGAVIMALWAELAAFMERNRLEAMIGCASVTMNDGGHHAASLWTRLQAQYLSEPAFRLTPRLPLPVEQLDTTLDAEPPALLKGYLRCGARILGAPAWDPDFNTADLPVMLQLADLPARYRRHFLRAG